MIVVVTGASGFIGHAIGRAIVERGWTLRQVAHRRAPDAALGRVYNVGDMNDATAWSEALTGADGVIHLAARVHGARDDAERGADAYYRVNTDGTLTLAHAATAAGVKRLVYFSSIGVNGPTDGGAPFTESSAPRPINPYADSKWQAEQRLSRLALETVVLRPPLVYGPQAPGNFAKLLRWVDAGLPLPFGRAHHRRSLIGVANLVDVALLALTHPRAANETFLVADGDDISFAELLRRLAHLLKRPSRLLPVPTSWLKAAARGLRLSDAHVHLTDPLRIDIRKARENLGWTPPRSLDAGLREAVEAFRQVSGRR